jgi:hypothetical protein
LPAPAYTVELYSVSGLSSSSPEITPPSGRVYVVRDVCCYSSIGLPDIDASLYWQDAITGGTIAFFDFNAADETKKSFQWTGRQAFGSLGGFKFSAGSSSWDIRVTGYDLSA